MGRGIYLSLSFNIIMNLPNTISLLRIILSPIFFISFVYLGKWGLVFSFLIFAIIEISDLLDGIIARRRKIITDFGKLFDPFADKIARMTYFIAFLHCGYYPGWMLLLIFYREYLITIMRQVAERKGVVIAAKWSGKVKSQLQGIGTLVILLSLIAKEFLKYELPVREITYWTMFVITFVTVVSAVEYLILHYTLFKEIEK